MIAGTPVFSPSTGTASTTRTATDATPNSTGRRQSSSAQRAKTGERCPPECTHGSASRSTRSPSRASTAGSSVSVAASTNTTESMIPSAIERNAGLGTSITAESEISTVTPEKSTALPAVSIVTAVASSAEICEPKWAPRYRATMNSA